MTTDEAHGDFEATPDPMPAPGGAVPDLHAAAASLRRTHRQLVAELRGRLSALRQQHARFNDLVRGGHTIRAAGSAPPRSDDDLTWPEYGLTEREVEVARLLAEGRRNIAIASALGISPHTARHHTQRVLAKLGVHSRAEAGAKLRR